MISLPNQLELQTLFSGFLFETGLSNVSVKNYLSDLRHFFSFCASITSKDNPPTVQEIFQNISKYVNLYLDEQRKSFTPQNTINRRSASIRRFSTFLSTKFGLVSPLDDTSHKSSLSNTSPSLLNNDKDDSLPTISRILEHFRVFLIKEKKTHSTVKNYVSDLNHFFAWSASETPFLDQNLENILSESHLNTYVTYLRLSHTSTSVINRRQSSVKQFTRYCFLQKYIPKNPFEYVRDVPHLTPLSWFERFSSKKKSEKGVSKSRLGVLYQKYNSLPFTPYLHLAILVLATSAMVIFGYNQIVKQAKPSSAALPTVPRRQLSFQGRLTDSSATPITTSVNVTFKLWNDPTAGTQLYTSNTCAIVPDPNGIFNTLIGDGTCGQEIANTVFTENRDVYLEVTVGAETLHPRQQIATVGYALNSETLQGYPASGSATINTVPIVDNSGNINIAVTSPSIISTSGTFTLNGQALTLSTAANSGGNIVLQPDAIGAGQVQVLGATTSTDTLRIQNANLTSGALISGYIGNNTATGRLLSLTAGSTETDRFYVAASGQTMINTSGTLANAGLIINQNGSGDLLTASSSGTSKFTIAANGNISATGTLTGLTGLTVNSGTVSLPANSITNNYISELDWTKLQNYPTACPTGQVVQAVGDTLTCVSMVSSLWQRTSGSLAPLNITDSINLGSTATSSALVHLAGTLNENSWINTGTGNFGIGATNPTAKLFIDNTAIPNGLDLITNGTFTGSAASWTLHDSAAYDTNNVSVNGLPGYIETNVNIQNGKTYQLTFTLSNVTGDTVGYGFVTNGSSSSTGAGNGTHTFTFLGNHTGADILVFENWDGNSGATWTIDNVSLREISFNPALKVIGYDGTTYLSLADNLDDNLGMGKSVLSSMTSGINNTALGSYSLTANTTGNNNTAIGTLSLPANTIGYSNSALGSYALQSNIGGYQNSAVGDSALASNTEGYTNSAFGIWALQNNTIGHENTAVGANTLTNNTEGNYNTAVGNDSQSNTTLGNENASLGFHSLQSNTTGSYNTAVGAYSLLFNNGSYNTSLGHFAGAYSNSGLNQTSSNSLYLGYNTESLNNGDTNEIVIGYNAVGAGSNTAVLGNDSIITTLLKGNVGLGLTNPTYKLDVTGDINLTGALRDNGSSGTPGQLLSTTGTGVQWIDAPITGSTNSSPWDWNTGVISPFSITDAVNLGNAATASATVHLAGTPGDNSFINTGNFGIGKTNPGYALDVNGSVNISGSYLVNGSPLTASNWQRTLGSLAPLNITDSVNIGATSTASALIHLAGTTDENSWFNTGTLGNLGIGTTAPVQKLHVEGHCVTADTILPIRRRRRKNSNEMLEGDDDEFTWDEYFERIDRVLPGDEVLSLNEQTGNMEYARINKLMDMGIKEVYELTTKSGKVIRTTSEHPYLTQLS